MPLHIECRSYISIPWKGQALYPAPLSPLYIELQFRESRACAGGLGSLGSLLALWAGSYAAMRPWLLGRTGRANPDLALRPWTFEAVCLARTDVSASEEAWSLVEAIRNAHGCGLQVSSVWKRGIHRATGKLQCMLGCVPSFWLLLS